MQTPPSEVTAVTPHSTQHIICLTHLMQLRIAGTSKRQEVPPRAVTKRRTRTRCVEGKRLLQLQQLDFTNRKAAVGH